MFEQPLWWMRTFKSLGIGSLNIARYFQDTPICLDIATKQVDANSMYMPGRHKFLLCDVRIRSPRHLRRSPQELLILRCYSMSFPSIVCPQWNLVSSQHALKLSQFWHESPWSSMWGYCHILGYWGEAQFQWFPLKLQLMCMNAFVLFFQ